jgi:acetylornithine/succinyldiaminopimelate/putrescine aminotransferase
VAVAKKAIDAVKRKNLAELQNLHDEMVKELAVLKRAIDALKAVQGKPKRAKK